MADTKDIPIVKPSLAEKAVEASLKTKRPLMLWGPPGVGKSAIVRQVADKHGIGFIDARLCQMDPTDLRGLPYVVRDEKGNHDPLMGFAASKFLPREGRGILFLDELPQALPIVQNAASELLLDRRCGEYELPEGWIIVAAGNRRGDRAGTVEIPRHLLNRLIHLEVAPDVEDWVAWAEGSGKVHKGIVEFIKANPKALHQFSPDVTACPTCRTWEYCSDVVKAVGDKKEDKDVMKVLLQGAIGKGHATTLMAFLMEGSDRPTFADIVKTPSKATIPEATATAFAVGEECVEKVTAENLAPVLQYLERLQPEITMAIAFQIMHREKKLPDLKPVEALLKKLEGA